MYVGEALTILISVTSAMSKFYPVSLRCTASSSVRDVACSRLSFSLILFISARNISLCSSACYPRASAWSRDWVTLSAISFLCRYGPSVQFKFSSSISSGTVRAILVSRAFACRDMSLKIPRENHCCRKVPNVADLPHLVPFAEPLLLLSLACLHS